MDWYENSKAPARRSRHIELCASSSVIMVNTQEKLSSWMAVDMGYLKIQFETFLSAFGFSWLLISLMGEEVTHVDVIAVTCVLRIG